MSCTKENFIAAVNSPIAEVYYCDHHMDNTFVRCDLSKTIAACNERVYLPVKYCKNPSYSEASGVALVLKNSDDSTFWVHIPKPLFRQWLTQMGQDWREHPVWKK